MKFSKEFLLDLVGETAGGTLDDANYGLVTVISNDIRDRDRWSVHYVQIFGFGGNFYRTWYRSGATEQQDESPYESDPDEIECVEVFPKEVTITIYE